MSAAPVNKTKSHVSNDHTAAAFARRDSSNFSAVLQPQNHKTERTIMQLNIPPATPLPIRQMLVPVALMDQLRRHKGNYSDIKTVFHCLCVGVEHYVGVVGDGDNGAYEFFEYRDGKLTCSDCGYGDTVIALFSILQKVVVL